MTLSFHGYNYICISVFGKFKGLKQLLPVVIDKFILYFTSNYKVVNQYVDILGFSKLKKQHLRSNMWLKACPKHRTSTHNAGL